MSHRPLAKAFKLPVFRGSWNADDRLPVSVSEPLLSLSQSLGERWGSVSNEMGVKRLTSSSHERGLASGVVLPLVREACLLRCCCPFTAQLLLRLPVLLVLGGQGCRSLSGGGAEGGLSVSVFTWFFLSQTPLFS